jgi:hypothetical protein
MCLLKDLLLLKSSEGNSIPSHFVVKTPEIAHAAAVMVVLAIEEAKRLNEIILFFFFQPEV